jgi:hypothetical protein
VRVINEKSGVIMETAFIEGLRKTRPWGKITCFPVFSIDKDRNVLLLSVTETINQAMCLKEDLKNDFPDIFIVESMYEPKIINDGRKIQPGQAKGSRIKNWYRAIIEKFSG